MSKPLCAALLVSIIGCFVTSCAQKYGIAKAHVFTRESVGGNIPVDKNSNPISTGVVTQHIIYIETTGNKPLPEWDVAWIDQKPYKIQAHEVRADSIVVGEKKDLKTRVILKKKAGNRLWQLLLAERENFQPDATLAATVQENKLVLTGKYKQTPFSYKISSQQELEAAFTQ